MGLVPLQVGGIEPHATGLLDGHAHENCGHAHENCPQYYYFMGWFSFRYSSRIEFSRERAVGTGNNPFNLSLSFLSHSTSAPASAAIVLANSPRECLAVISLKAKCLEVGRPAVPVLTASIAPQTSAAAGSGRPAVSVLTASTAPQTSAAAGSGFQLGGGSIPSARSHSIAVARRTQQLLIK